MTLHKRRNGRWQCSGTPLHAIMALCTVIASLASSFLLGPVPPNSILNDMGKSTSRTGTSSAFQAQPIKEDTQRLTTSRIPPRQEGSRILVCSSMSAYEDGRPDGANFRSSPSSLESSSSSLESSILSLKNMTQSYLDDLAQDVDDYDGEVVGERLRKQTTLAATAGVANMPATKARVGQKAVILSSDDTNKSIIYEAAFPLAPPVATDDDDDKDTVTTRSTVAPFPPPNSVSINSQANAATTTTTSPSIGMTLQQISATNGQLSNIVLDLDTQQYLPSSFLSRDNLVQSGIASETLVMPEDFISTEKLGTSSDETDLAGVLVASVNTKGYAYKAGVRPGDRILATSATIGEQLWPKSTLEGIRSAVTSRKFMSSSNPDLVIRFLRTEAYISSTELVESFELSLSRPIGMLIENIKDLDVLDRRRLGLKDDNNADGVVVTGFSSDGSSASNYLRKGDRIVAVESSLGSRMWPVSSTAGVRSAVTSRLPSQPIKFRFERLIQVGEYKSGDVEQESSSPVLSSSASSVSAGTSPFLSAAGAGKGASVVSNVKTDSALSGAVQGYRSLASAMAPPEAIASSTTVDRASSSSVIESGAAGSRTHQLLLGRCRDILRTYKNKAREYRAKDDMTSAMRILSHVGDRVLDAINDAGAPLDAQTLSMIMNTYVDAGEIEKALKTFEIATGLSSEGTLVTSASNTINGKRNSIPVSPYSTLNVYTATSLLKAHASNNDIASIRSVLSAMTATVEDQEKNEKTNDVLVAPWPVKVNPDSQCYNILLGTLGNLYGSKAALDLFEKMPNNSAAVEDVSKKTNSFVFPSKTLVTYNTMLDLLAQEGRLDDALTVFDRMKSDGMKPDKVSYTSLIKAQVNGGMIDDGIALVREMMNRRIKVDVLTYNTIIKGFCQRGKWYEAQNLVAEMEQKGVSPNSVTYVLLMNGLLKSQRPSSCLVLFESATSDPKTAPLMENVQAFTTAVTAASAMGDYDRALELVGRMQSLGIKPTIQTLTSLMNACLASGKPDMAISVYKQMQRLTSNSAASGGPAFKSKEKIDGVALTTLLRAMCDSQEFDQAMTLLTQQKDGYQEMTGKQIMLSFKYLVKSSLDNNNYEIATKAFESMLSSGYIPSKDLIRTSILEPLGYYSSSRCNNKRNASVVSPRATGLDDSAKDDEKFKFLLLIMDMLRGRKLPCDVMLYTSVLSEGTRLGGKDRLIASLLANSRKENVDVNVSSETESTAGTWTDLFKTSTSQKLRTLLKDGNITTIPSISVQKAKGEREVRLLVNAERSVSGSRSRRKR